ncbi:MAG: glycerophosphoryl diester phosphodiesterase [Actinomycetota bacterium]|nr:glycerophosphoryl diester phosphodiesterase [Actinomycetota bacterium]
MSTRRTVLACLATAAPAPAFLGAFPAVAPSGQNPRRRPSERVTVVAHRGASALRPEHTLAAYELAARLGADYLEPDLVCTADGVLVCRHEPAIGGTTDVADRPEFASRRRTVTLDGVSVTDWFTHDFTLAELRTLRAKERLGQIRQRNTLLDGRWPVPTLQEVLQLRKRLSAELGREIGVYPETKHPTYFRSLGLALEERLLRALGLHGLNRAQAPVYVQSFEVSNLRALRGAGARFPLVQLINADGAPYDTVAAGKGPTYADLLTPRGLRGIAQYAQGVGPEKGHVVPCRSDGSLGPATDLVEDAHEAGLLVHPWTFRAENTFLPARLRVGDDPKDYGRMLEELQVFLRAGIDGFFTDHPDLGALARDGAARRN